MLRLSKDKRNVVQLVKNTGKDIVIPSTEYRLNNQDKEITISESGEYEITPDMGYTGIGRVVIKVILP